MKSEYDFSNARRGIFLGAEPTQGFSDNNREEICATFETEIAYLSDFVQKKSDFFPEFMDRLSLGCEADSKDAVIALAKKINEDFISWCSPKTWGRAFVRNLPQSEFLRVYLNTLPLAFDPSYIRLIQERAPQSNLIVIPENGGYRSTHFVVPRLIKQVSCNASIQSVRDEVLDSKTRSKTQTMWEVGPSPQQQFDEMLQEFFELYGINPASRNSLKILDGKLTSDLHFGRARFLLLKNPQLAAIIRKYSELSSLMILLESESCVIHKNQLEDRSYPRLIGENVFEMLSLCKEGDGEE